MNIERVTAQLWRNIGHIRTITHQNELRLAGVGPFSTAPFAKMFSPGEPVLSGVNRIWFLV